MKKLIILLLLAAFLLSSCKEGDKTSENSSDSPISSETVSETGGDISSETESAEAVTKEDLPISYAMLGHWMRGEGQKLTFKESDPISVAMKNSPKIKALAEEAVISYKNGLTTKHTWVEFTREEPDLWLSVRKAYVDITTTEQDGGYHLKMRVYDKYNFEKNDSNDGLGSTLNNLGYMAEQMGLGTPFDWEAEITFIMQNAECRMQN